MVSESCVLMVLPLPHSLAAFKTTSLCAGFVEHRRVLKSAIFPLTAYKIV